MKNLRAAVIGAGYLGKFHAEKYAKLENVELIGVVDLNRERCENVASCVGTSAFTDYRELLGKVDIASIVVPSSLHFEISRDCLENGIDLFIEKPMTTTLQEADELIALSQAKGRYIQVGHIERYNPAIIALENIVNTPQFIESHRLSITKDRGTDTCVVLDLMIHDIDIILKFVKSEIKDIQAVGLSMISDHVDIANARLTFTNGCIANMTASRITCESQRKMVIYQADEYISVDMANKEIDMIRLDDINRGGILPRITRKRFDREQTDPLAEEIKDFVSSVSRRVTPEVSCHVGRKALKIALSILEQINTCGHSRNYFEEQSLKYMHYSL